MNNSTPSESIFETLVGVAREAALDREVKDVEGFARLWAADYLDSLDLDAAYEDALDAAAEAKRQEKQS